MNKPIVLISDSGGVADDVLASDIVDDLNKYYDNIEDGDYIDFPQNLMNKLPEYIIKQL
jgi:hypothetical protein